jgi:hypothetical protein
VYLTPLKKFNHPGPAQRFQKQNKRHGQVPGTNRLVFHKITTGKPRVVELVSKNNG